MAIRFLTPKVTCSLITGGSACAGGGTLYWYQLPRNWKELFEKEGKVFLKEDNDYKGMYVDQKDSDEWKQENDLKDATESDVKDKAKSYCEKELGKPISSENYDSTRKKLLSFCTIEGIVSVKGRLTHSGKNGWIEGNDEEKKYKAVFSVYRYNDEFLKWLNEKENEKDKLTKESKVSEKYQKLKNKCETSLKLDYKVANQNTLKYSYWWCTELGYKTIKERIQKLNNSWQNETDGATIKSKWENTEKIKNRVKSDQSKNDGDTLQDSDYSSWCTTHLAKELSEDDSYQDKYLALMSACKKQS